MTNLGQSSPILTGALFPSNMQFEMEWSLGARAEYPKTTGTRGRSPHANHLYGKSDA